MNHNKKFGIKNANDVVLYDLKTGKVVAEVQSAVVSMVREPIVKPVKQEKEVYKLTKFFKGGGEHTWAVEGTLEEIFKLSCVLVYDDKFKPLERVTYDVSPSLTATHKFDEHGQLWCKTPINIKS